MRLPVLLAAVVTTMLGTSAEAQSLAPMRGQVVSYADRFALRLHPGNPYDKGMTMSMAVYDEAYRPIRAAVFPERQVIGPGGNGSVTVVVPFDGTRERRVRVCARAHPLAVPGGPSGRANIVTEVCGRYRAVRRQLKD